MTSGLTNPPKLKEAKRKSEDHGIEGPFPLHDKGSENEEAGRDMNLVEHLPGKKWFGHFGAPALRALNSSIRRR